MAFAGTGQGRFFWTITCGKKSEKASNSTGSDPSVSDPEKRISRCRFTARLRSDAQQTRHNEGDQGSK